MDSQFIALRQVDLSNNFEVNNAIIVSLSTDIDFSDVKIDNIDNSLASSNHFLSSLLKQ